MEQEVQQIKATLTEVEFASRWNLIQAYHEIGKVLASLEDKTKLLRILAQETGQSERKFWHMIKFAKKFPDLDSSLPEAKNTSWNSIVRKYLTDKETPEDHECIPMTVCKICRRKLNV